MEVGRGKGEVEGDYSGAPVWTAGRHGTDYGDCLQAWAEGD